MCNKYYNINQYMYNAFSFCCTVYLKLRFCISGTLVHGQFIYPIPLMDYLEYITVYFYIMQ